MYEMVKMFDLTTGRSLEKGSDQLFVTLYTLSIYRLEKIVMHHINHIYVY